MVRVGHVIGNGDSAISAYKPSKGFKITCNLPPMHVENTYGTCLVDFKMMRAISDGSVQVPGDWIMGALFFYVDHLDWVQDHIIILMNIKILE